MSEYVIPVPGRFRDDAVMVDVETAKVPTPNGYRMPNGEVLRRRWSVILAGVATAGAIVIVDPEGDEEAGLEALSDFVPEGVEAVYGATREFDEMVLRGRMTNARRAHLPRPTWPAMPGAERVRWVNAGVEKFDAPRGEDVPSRDVPTAWATPEGWLPVMIHLLRDVAEMILRVGRPDAECEKWCRRVLSDYAFAGEMITDEPEFLEA